MSEDETLCCQICFEEYNENEHAPRIVPCRESHTFCSSCLQDLLNKPDQNFTCPLDRDSLQLPSKSIENFPKNSDLLFMLGALRSAKTKKCEKHNTDCDMICLTDGTLICHFCTRRGEKNQFDSSVPLQDFDKTFQTSSERIRVYANSVNSDREEKIIMVQKSERELQELINQRVQDLVIKIDAAKENLFKASSDYFLSLAGKQLANASVDEIISEPLRQAEKVLEEFEKEEVKSDDITKMKCKVINNETLLKDIITDDWLRKLQVENNTLRKQISTASEKFLDLADKTFQNIISPNISNQNLDNFINFLENGHQQSIPLESEIVYADHLSQEETPEASLESSTSIFPLEAFIHFKENWNIDVNFIEDNGIFIQQRKEKLLGTNEIAEICTFVQKGKTDAKMDMLVSNVVEADFRFQRLTNKGMKFLNETLQEFVSLKSLKLFFKEFGSIKDQNLSKFLPKLSKLNQLTSIQLEFYKWNQLSEQYITKLVQELSVLGQLKTLKLAFTKCSQIQDEDLDSILWLKPLMHKLKDMQISFTECNELTAKKQTIPDLSGLKRLTLHYNQCGSLKAKNLKRLQESLTLNSGVSVDIKSDLLE